MNQRAILDPFRVILRMRELGMTVEDEAFQRIYRSLDVLHSVSGNLGEERPYVDRRVECGERITALWAIYRMEVMADAEKLTPEQRHAFYAEQNALLNVYHSKCSYEEALAQAEYKVSQVQPLPDPSLADLSMKGPADFLPKAESSWNERSRHISTLRLCEKSAAHPLPLELVLFDSPCSLQWGLWLYEERSDSWRTIVREPLPDSSLLPRVAAMEAAHAWFTHQAMNLRIKIFDASFSEFFQPGEVDMSQTHNQFKVFVGPVEPGNRIDAVAERVKAFAKGVASKSIGVEYLEASKRVVVTLGYREDEDAYPVSLFLAPLGQIEGLGLLDDEERSFVEIEKGMEAAAAKINDVICHELFITEDGEFLMVILAKAKV